MMGLNVWSIVTGHAIAVAKSKFSPLPKDGVG